MPTQRAGRGQRGPVPLLSAPCVPPTAASTVVPIPGTFSWPLAARGKPRRGMLRRAVFSDVQRKALEKMFQKQKYISKPDRKKLAAKLGLKDSQVRRDTRGGESWVPPLHPSGQLEGRGGKGDGSRENCRQPRESPKQVTQPRASTEPKKRHDSQLGD